MSLTVFDFESQIVRVVIHDLQPWWVAADVCAILELGNSRISSALLDSDEKGVHNIDTLGGASK